MKYYVIKDDFGAMLEFCQNPYGDGKECLVNNIPTSFTIFMTKKSASRALRVSKKYAKNDEIQDLEKHWNIAEWKVCPIEIDQ